MRAQPPGVVGVDELGQIVKEIQEKIAEDRMKQFACDTLGVKPDEIISIELSGCTLKVEVKKNVTPERIFMKMRCGEKGQNDEADL